MEEDARRTKNLFITGPPRCGKSTLIEKVVRRARRPITAFSPAKKEGREEGRVLHKQAGRHGRSAGP